VDLFLCPLKYRIFDIVEILDDHCGVIPIQIRVHHLLAYTTQLFCPVMPRTAS